MGETTAALGGKAPEHLFGCLTGGCLDALERSTAHQRHPRAACIG